MNIADKSSSVLKRDLFLLITRIFTSAIIARKLGPEMLGISIIVMLIPSYAEAFGRLKFDMAAVYFLGRRKYALDEVVWTLNALALLTSGLVVAGICWQFTWIYQLLFARSSFDATGIVYLALLGIPLHFLWMNYSYLLLHLDDIATYNRMIVISALGSSLLAIGLLFLTDLGLWAVIGSSVLATFLSLAYGMAKFGSAGAAARRFNRALIADLFRYGSKLYAGGVVAQLQAYLTNLLVAMFLVPSQVAYFSLARGLGQMVDRVPAALGTVLFPRLTKIDDAGEAARLVARAFRYMLAIMLAVGILAAALVYPAVFVLYGRDYLPLVTPFFIIVPGIVAAGAAAPFLQYFMSIDRADLGITLPILPLLAQVASAYWLIPRLGAEGAAIAFSASLVLFALISAWMFARICAITASDLVTRRADLRDLAGYTARQLSRLWLVSRFAKARSTHPD